MKIDSEISEFTSAIGATVPVPGDENYGIWRSLFKRGNYFQFGEQIMVVKISRIEKPFWGVRKLFVDLLNNFDDYFLVLLTPKGSGWVFRKPQINGFVGNGTWKEGANGDYKINWPLPDRYHFRSPDDFLKRFC